MDTQPLTAEHLKSRGFDGVCYRATRPAKSGKRRTFECLVYRVAATGAYIFALAPRA